MDIFIFDVDGTLSNNEHRLKYIREDAWIAAQNGCDDSTFAPFPGVNWDAFHAECGLDTPILPMCYVAAELIHNVDKEYLFVTGRMEKCRQDTIDWLHTYVLPWISKHWISGHLLMRADGDTRPDFIIKEEILDKLEERHGKGCVKMAFDDRPQVLEMWKRRGILVAAIGMKEPF